MTRRRSRLRRTQLDVELQVVDHALLVQICLNNLTSMHGYGYTMGMRPITKFYKG